MYPWHRHYLLLGFQIFVLVSVFTIGFIFSPLILSPMSEIYGRLLVTHIANVVFFVASILCAVAVDIQMLIVFRLIMGLSGCVPLTLGGGFVADLMPVEKRGLASIIWTVGPLMTISRQGPVIVINENLIIGPVIGGYMALNVGWRWIFWLQTILGGVTMIMCFLLVRETYAPRLLHEKAIRLQKETGRRMRGKFDKGQTPSITITTAISRPTILLMRSPIVGLLSLYVAIVYSYMYLLFTTFTNVFDTQYGFNSGEAGLSYLGLGVGFCLSQVTVMRLSSWYRRQQLEKCGSNKPEDQLLPLILGSIVLPIGLVWYGWSTKAHTHWIVPSMARCSWESMYLVDAYTIYAASAIAANTIVRSIFGAVIPLAGSSLYARLGLGWGNALLGFIAVVFAPGSWLLLKYGDRIRTNPRFQPKL
ncbi:hypothetical protein DPV78_003383 [Talaromyces pinophilus]|nr:hypothetical protein DPV78_003383 [Talaromyces pinophilus]